MGDHSNFHKIMDIIRNIICKQGRSVVNLNTKIIIKPYRTSELSIISGMFC